MTIRQHIKARFFALLRNALALFVGLQVLGLIVQRWPGVFEAAPWFYGIAAATMWIVMAVYAIGLLRIRCPRCAASLGGSGLAVAIGMPNDGRCRHCHVSFDQPVEVPGPR